MSKLKLSSLISLVIYGFFSIEVAAQVTTQVTTSQVEGYLEVYHPNDHSSLYLGIEAGRFAQTDMDKFNTFVGTTAGFANTSGSANTFVGNQCGLLNKTGFWNCFFGTEVGKSNDSGNFNSFFGTFSGRLNFGSSNSFFGANAGAANKDGGENSFFGWATGAQNVNGNRNSFYGVFAGNSIQGGSDNTFIGHKSGHKVLLGSKNVCIGSQAGPPTTNAQISNRLYIDVEESNTPLIYGEFDNDRLQINGRLVMGNTNHFNGNDDGLIRSSNSIGSDLFLVANDAIILEIGDVANEEGTFEVWNQSSNDVLMSLNESGNLTTKGTVNGSSDRHRKEKITDIDLTSILTEIMKLPITEWQYKGEDHIRHLGPMAQDFFQAFGLGTDETTISMVDADGVALAAIKALVTENECLRWESQSLRSDLEKLQHEMSQLQRQIQALYWVTRK